MQAIISVVTHAGAMRGVLLSVEQAKGLWCHQVTHRFPGLDVRVLGLVPCQSGRFFETVELRGEGADQAVRALHSMHNVENVAPIEVAPNHALVRISVHGCPLVEAMRDTGAVPHLPFNVLPGEDHWLVVGAPGDGQRLLVALAGSGLERRVVRSGDWHAALDELTPLQRETLESAVRLGYYEYPRGISLTELARRRGVAKSTLSQTLRIIEKKIMAVHVTAQRERKHVNAPHALPVLPTIRWATETS